jgi:hypothetical protein
VWVKIEIIIDKKQNVAVPSEAKDRIALPGKPEFCLDERYIWKSIRRIAHIRQFCVRYQDLVWLSLLLRQKGNRLDEDCGASASSNTNHQIRSCISGAKRLAFHYSFRQRDLTRSPGRKLDRNSPMGGAPGT